MDHNWTSTYVGDYLSVEVTEAAMHVINTGVFTLNIVAITVALFSVLWTLRFYKSYPAILIILPLVIASVTMWNSLYMMLSNWDPGYGESYPQVIYSHKVFYDFSLIMVSLTIIRLKNLLR